MSGNLKRSIQWSLGLVLPLVLVLLVLIIGQMARGGKTAAQTSSNLPAPVQMTAAEDHQRIMGLLNITSMPRGADGNNRSAPNAANYDESKANPYPNLPDPLVMKSGQKVTSARMWNQRRAEILEDFEREIYGRTPRKTPKVTWEVTDTRNDGTVITKQLVGHVDNSAYPLIKVDLQASLTVPANATKPVPVIMQFSGGGGARGGAAGAARGGAAGPAPGAAPGGATQIQPSGAPTVGAPGGAAPAPRGGVPAPGGAAPASAQGGAGGGRGAAAGPSWQQQVLSRGWGYATFSTGSVQADNGAGLTAGIIGLVNKGQPRKLDDWGVLAAWAWGASRVLDYFETDKSVDARQVGLEGHSRWGKATIVALAFDERFAIGYVSSSGAGGAHINTRTFGELIENVAGSGEYHWMAGNFLKYAGHYGDMPVDGHELVALVAPRPVFISGGANGDSWQDPKGMFMAAAGAGPVYRLLGKKDMGTSEFPPAETALVDGEVAFRQHSGGHTDGPNWPTFLTFADRYIKGPKPVPAKAK